MTAWQARVEVPQAAVDAVEAFFESLGDPCDPPAISSFALGIGDRWRVDAIFAEGIEPEDINRLIGKSLNPLAFSADALSFEPVATIDWVEESLKHHLPVRAGRYHVYGSHHEPPANTRHAILIDANVAFGTGQHETTLGCLRALDTLARCSTPGRILDVGTGTGILAIAAARTWKKPVLATDIDPEAVRVAAKNAAANGTTQWIDTLTAAGLDHPAIRRRRYDLVTANILAGPLRELAADLTGTLMPGGTLVLSGFLYWQEQAVLAAYRNRGLVLRQRFIEGDWVTLMLKKQRG